MPNFVLYMGQQFMLSISGIARWGAAMWPPVETEYKGSKMEISGGEVWFFAFNKSSTMEPIERKCNELLWFV